MLGLPMGKDWQGRETSMLAMIITAVLFICVAIPIVTAVIAVSTAYKLLTLALDRVNPRGKG